MKQKIMKMFSLALIVTILAAASLVVPVAATETSSGTWGKNLTWTLEDGTLTVSGIGQMGYGQYSWNDYRDAITSIVIEDGVTTIASEAFSACTNLTNVTISDSVTTIENEAFYNCSNLSSVTLSNHLTYLGYGAFGNCTSLTEIHIPKSLNEADVFWGTGPFTGSNLQKATFEVGTNSVVAYLFYKVENLTEVELLDTMTLIGKSAFAYCGSLKNITIPKRVKTISASAFENCILLEQIVLSDSVTTIENEAFYNCSNLANVTLPNRLTYLGIGAFGNCASLTEIHIPKSLNEASRLGYEGPFTGTNLQKATFEEGTTSVAANLFYNVENLTEVELVDTMTLIGENAFAYCGSLKNITIPERVKTISESAFENCILLEQIIIPDSVTTIEEDAFYNCLNLSKVTLSNHLSYLGYRAFGNCAILTEIHIPKSLNEVDTKSFYSVSPFAGTNLQKATFEEGTTSVLPKLFYKVDTLVEVELADSITFIGDHAFAYCESLKNVTIPEKVKTISDFAFESCILLEQIIIPDSVTAIETHAFYNCLNLSNVTLSNRLSYLGGNAFGNCTSLTEIHIPKSLNKASIAGGEGPFSASNLQKATFEEGTTSVVARLFDNVDTLAEVELVDSMTLVGTNAFARCYSLENILIPASITTIECAFRQCTMLAEIIFEGNAPASIDKNCFENVTATAYYPAGNATWTDDVKQDYGGDITWVARTAEEVHTHSYEAVVTAATCEEGGYTTYTCACGNSYIAEETDALGHSFEKGICTVCGASDPDYELPDIPVEEKVLRLAGSNRFDTGFMVADQMKVNLGIEKFDAVIVASGTNFADALSGSYLAAVKKAPILLSFTTDAINNQVKDYIRNNLNPGGTVYILGGESAVPASMAKGLDGFEVKRLKGNDRFGTNLEILKEAGVGDKPMLVCTGLSFADSLSASATELPILLVWKNLTEAQKAFLASLNGNELYVIGGESAVSTAMEAQIGEYGVVERVQGSNRFETSIAIAERFFYKPKTAVVAYAWNFPDGLCGGPLASTMDAPLILTMDKYEARAAEYLQGQGVKAGTVLGGEALISDAGIRTIFDLDAGTKIPQK